LRVVAQLGEFTKGGKITERLEVHELEEAVGRAVEEGTARLFLLADDAQELTLEERAEHRTGVDAADLVDLGARDGLAVGDDGQGL